MPESLPKYNYENAVEALIAHQEKLGSPQEEIVRSVAQAALERTYRWLTAGAVVTGTGLEIHPSGVHDDFSQRLRDALELRGILNGTLNDFTRYEFDPTGLLPGSHKKDFYIIHPGANKDLRYRFMRHGRAPIFETPRYEQFPPSLNQLMEGPMLAIIERDFKEHNLRPGGSLAKGLTVIKTTAMLVSDWDAAKSQAPEAVGAGFQGYL